MTKRAIDPGILQILDRLVEETGVPFWEIIEVINRESPIALADLRQKLKGGDDGSGPISLS